jgi:bacterial/archaeal transporter family protein
MNKTLISILGGLGGMFGWGVSDFFANLSSDKVGHFKAFFWSQVAGLLTVLCVVLFFQPSVEVSLNLVLMILVAGISYSLGYLFFYKGFEIGNVSIVSAVINSQNLLIVLIAYFVFHQTLTAIQVPALLTVLVGIILVSVDFKELKKGGNAISRGVKETLLAAVFFGVIYWPFNEFISERIDWRLATLLIKITAVSFVFLFSQFKKEDLKLSKKIGGKFLLFIALTGILEAVGVLGTSFGLAYGDSIIVGPISSALTLVTVTLAVIFLKEKLTKIQALGIILTVGGIVATAF